MKFEIDYVDAWSIQEGLAETFNVSADKVVYINHARGEYSGENVWLFTQINYGSAVKFYIVYSDSYGQCEVEEYNLFDMAIAHFMRYMPLFQS